MKKSFYALLLLLLSLTVSAQHTSTPAAPNYPEGQQDQPTLKFGYFSYEQVLHAMPDYTIASHRLEELKAKYDAEVKRSSDDFNNRYEDFLDVQRKLEPSILRKRQAELEELMDRNVAFRNETARLLKQAEKDIFAPVHQKLSTTIGTIGKQRGYAFIINSDHQALPYVNSLMGEDITETLISALK